MDIEKLKTEFHKQYRPLSEQEKKQDRLWYSIYRGRLGKFHWTVTKLDQGVIRILKEWQLFVAGPFRSRDEARHFVRLDDKYFRQYMDEHELLLQGKKG